MIQAYFKFEPAKDAPADPPRAPSIAEMKAMFPGGRL